MKFPFFSFLLAAFMAAGIALPAAAEKADRDKPLNAEADALRYNDLKQTSVFTGNVVITKGTTLIRGGQVDVSQDPEGYQLAIATAAPGKLAYFRKKRDGVNEFIEGEGERIEYDSRADLVKFIGRAVVRRYIGATLADETTGALIVYDNNTDTFSVDASAKNINAANPGGRVRAMISPRGSPAGAAAQLPPSGAGRATAPLLKPSITLDNSVPAKAP